MDTKANIENHILLCVTKNFSSIDVLLSNLHGLGYHLNLQFDYVTIFTINCAIIFGTKIYMDIWCMPRV
jgi:hypothetical protein